jgi:hypothetical protein
VLVYDGNDGQLLQALKGVLRELIHACAPHVQVTKTQLCV